ncbi:hypothetical protein [Martelella alba]|uniref:Uncharacterized protein n=1 Tax=Martelella alba TaxID=2590451 RepID=A0ABY2SL75_9HYPH|nr:hypothetical protein [Martelella alba]TKI05525.1 hypothetical protein FCN80_14225 [Martelella alba]
MSGANIAATSKENEKIAPSGFPECRITAIIIQAPTCGILIIRPGDILPPLRPVLPNSSCFIVFFWRNHAGNLE